MQLVVWFNLGLVFEYINLGPFYRDEWSDFMTPFLTALLGLGLNEAAYMAEICRAGLLAVDEGQTEAAHALGMSYTKTLRRIVVAAGDARDRAADGQRGHQHAEDDLTGVGRPVRRVVQGRPGHRPDLRRPGRDAVPAAAWYLLLTSVFSVGQYYLERYYARGSSRSLPATPMQKIRANLLSLSNRSSTTGGAA